jgi:Na+/melibiose symporter-like transporter
VFFTYAGILLISVAGFGMFFPSSEAGGNGMLVRSSYPNFGLFCGVVGSAAMLISVFGTWSAIPSLRKPSGGGPQGNVLLAFVEVFRTLEQQSFRILFVSVLVFNTLAGVIATLLVYVATYVFDFKPEQLAGLASSVLVGIIFASTVAQSLARRFDKKNALALCVIVGGAFAFSPQVLYFTGVLEQMSTGTKFVYVFAVNGISQVFFIAYIILLDSMLSDVIDERELLSGQREEGLFFAARSFATKASYGLGSFFAGIGLDIIHFPRTATPDNVPPEAVLSLAILSGPVLFVLFAATVVISSRFPLTAAKHAEIMREIELRVIPGR